MLRIGPNLFLDENELSFEFVRSSGPGGQNVNKVATAVQLRFDLSANESLPNAIKARARALAGSKLVGGDVILITAQRHRTQHRNRQDAVERLVSLLQQAANPPKRRKKTRRTKGSIERRIQAKRHRGEKKRDRRPPRVD
ncbi:MAG: aminoacyl-tRNA hydrolase [Rhodothermales bacterium]|nr:aminoacyl-tRNA hydrolase [Rhodothermales bacterium]